jgi:hypothetical protein
VKKRPVKALVENTEDEGSVSSDQTKDGKEELEKE